MLKLRRVYIDMYIYRNVRISSDPYHVNVLHAFCRYLEPASPLSLYREPSFGHGRLRILNETHAYWSWHRNNDADAFVADTVWLESLSTSKVCRNTVDEEASTSSFVNDEL